MTNNLIQSLPEKQTCDHQYSEFSISEIRTDKRPFCSTSITGIGDPTIIVNQCFEEVQKLQKQKVKQKLYEFERGQELMKLKLQNYIRMLQRQLKKKDETNKSLRREIIDLQDEIFQCGGDIAIISHVTEEKRRKQYDRNITKQLKRCVMKNADSKLNVQIKSKQKSKLKSAKKKKENDKKSPSKGFHSTSKKKKKCSPTPKQKELKKLIF